MFETPIGRVSRSRLIDVSLSQETLHLAVSMLDRVLSKLAIERLKLQLVAVSCLMVSLR